MAEYNFMIRWPFILDNYESFHEDTVFYWRPGWRTESDEYSFFHTHDAEGWYAFTELNRCRPTPKSMERVFVHAQMFDPFGKPLSAKKIRCFTTGRLERLKGLHGWPVDSEADGECAERYRELQPFITPPTHGDKNGL